MKKLIALLAVVTLAGCGLRPGPPRPTAYEQWEPREDKTKTQADFERDHYECLRENPSVRARTATDMRDRCLAAKGWRRLGR